MPYYVIGAEQAVIGAVLSGRPLPPETRALSVREFGHPLAARVFSAVVRAREEYPDADAAYVAGPAAAWVDHPGITPGWLHGLAVNQISAPEVAGYSRFLHVVGFGTQLVLELDCVLQASGVNLPHMRDHHQQLGDLIERRVDMEQRFPLDGQNPRPRFSSLYGTQPAPDAARAAREDAILAGLIGDAQLSWPLCGWLEKWNFTSPLRRDVFDAITMLGRKGAERIDRDMLGVELAKTRGMDNFYDRQYGPDTELVTSRDIDLAYLDILIERSADGPQAATVFEHGRDLLTADLSARLTEHARHPTPGLQPDLGEPAVFAEPPWQHRPGTPGPTPGL